MTKHVRGDDLSDALDWVIRIQSQEFDDWEAHAAWLEADPGNPVLYHRASEALTDGISTLQQLAREPSPIAANDTSVRPGTFRTHRAWWTGAGLALAASITAFVMLPQRGVEPERVYQTAAGRNRQVTLAGGTSLALNGDTRVVVLGRAQRMVVVQKGEVFLRVGHDARHPFEVVTSGQLFRDVGTEFNVSVHGRATRLAVAEGAVAFDPDGENLRIGAGDALVVSGRNVTLSKVASHSVGSWRHGRLVYVNDTLDIVAADLTQSLGVPVDIAPELAHARFTGVLPLKLGPRDVVYRLANLLDAKVVKTKSGWSVGGSASETRASQYNMLRPITK
ncbi:FecR domain-containing protein [Sphingomonadaceae bacterium OTU29LAMAA1]|nr:FecR domain-containing protein [Sphingomonadaceae bacterium OTU29LAMAA1]